MEYLIFRSMIKNKIKSFLYIISGVVLFTSCDPTEKPKEVVQQPLVINEPEIPEIKFTVENQYPHDITSFTEGFLFHDGKLFESTGASPGLSQTNLYLELLI